MSLIKGAVRISRNSFWFPITKVSHIFGSIWHTLGILFLLENYCLFSQFQNSHLRLLISPFQYLAKLFHALILEILQHLFPSLCMGPPLARAYNYVKFIETGGGEVRGRQGDILAKTRSIYDGKEKLNTP